MTGLRPLYHAWLRLYLRWARHDLQHKDPTHPDLPLIVLRLAELEEA